MKIGSLFAGIGGFDLAGEWCGHHTIWTSEIDPYCVALLAERFPAAKQLGDITTIDWSHVERPDILTGGFPCQDISYAGKGAGLAGKRSGLWYEYARAIREVGPRYVIVENVRALFTRGFDAVLGTLADLGYDAEWSMYGAADVGAPHQRHRVWILAYATGGGRGAGASQPARRVDGGREGLGWADAVPVRGHDGTVRLIPRQAAEEGPQSPLWPVADGVPGRVARLRGIGNAIVPACALPIFGRIAEIEGQRPMREAA